MMKNPSLQDQTLGKSPSPGYNTFLLKQKENSGTTFRDSEYLYMGHPGPVGVLAGCLPVGP